MATWIVGLIAAGAGLMGVWWHAGGHLAARRRRLNQELEVLERLPADTRVQADMAEHVLRATRGYLRWSRRPLWRRLLISVGGAGLLVFIGAWVYVNYPELSKGGQPLPRGWGLVWLIGGGLLGATALALLAEMLDPIFDQLPSRKRKKLRLEEDQHDRYDRDQIRKNLQG